MALKINVEFQGRTYLAEVTPLVHGQEMPVKQAVIEAEKIKHIYSQQLQEMLKQYETDGEQGFLVEGTFKGFKFEKGEVAHKSIDVWKKFVEDLHKPEELLADEEADNAGPSAKAKFTDVTAYKQASFQEKKSVMASVYLKKVRELRGEKVDYTPIEQQYLACRKYTAFDLESEVGILRKRLRKHDKCNGDCEKKFTLEEWRDLSRRHLEIVNSQRAAEAP
jgi:hypothetical protein